MVWSGWRIIRKLEANAPEGGHSNVENLIYNSFSALIVNQRKPLVNMVQTRNTAISEMKTLASVFVAVVVVVVTGFAP